MSKVLLFALLGILVLVIYSSFNNGITQSPSFQLDNRKVCAHFELGEDGEIPPWWWTGDKFCSSKGYSECVSVEGEVSVKLLDSVDHYCGGNSQGFSTPGIYAARREISCSLANGLGTIEHTCDTVYEGDEPEYGDYTTVETSDEIVCCKSY